MGLMGDEPLAPAMGLNEADGLGHRSSAEIAKRVLKNHKAGLDNRRERDLLSEKLLLHIDGSGDFQWADIYEGTRVVIPRMLSPYRKTENVLRLIVDHAVAQHTTMDLRFLAEAPSDRRSIERSILDTLLVNHIAHEQDWNGLFAEALYLAMATGFCPVHGYWRDDGSHQWYDPVGYASGDAAMAPGGEQGYSQDIGPGMVDCFVGNPFDTVFDRGATRRSIHWCSYGRMLPAALVRQAFGHVPGVASLEGATNVPSASIFQMIAKSWNLAGLGVHGSPVMQTRRRDDEELLYTVCLEIAPGYDPQYPEGRLQMIAVPGNVDLRSGKGGGSPLLLVDQPLPAGSFSFSNFYSHQRGNDVHGKPWAEDIDQLQVDLNIAKSQRWRIINKMAEAPIVTSGTAMREEMTEINGYGILEIEGGMNSFVPQVMQYPPSIVAALDSEIGDLRQAMYTGGGYQAVSRGESPGSRMPYRAIIALQEADRSIHGPVHLRFKRSATNFARRVWRQFKSYGDVPWVIKNVSGDYRHLAEAWIDKSSVSDEPPSYKLVDAFGASPEMRAQEILELAQVQTPEGPLITRDEVRKNYPNQAIFDEPGRPGEVQRIRAKAIAQKIHDAAKAFRDQYQFMETDPRHPWIQQAGMMIFYELEETAKRMRDDDLMAHLATLSEITQDETADPIARVAAEMRQELYFQWQAEMMGMPLNSEGGGGPQGPAAGGAGQIEEPASGVNRMGIAAEAMGGAPTPGHGGVSL